MGFHDKKSKCNWSIIEKLGGSLSILILSVLTFLFCWIIAVHIDNGQNYVMVSIQCPSKRLCHKKNKDLYNILEKSLQQKNRSQYFDLYQKDGMIFIRENSIISGVDFITAAYDLTNQAIDKLNDTGKCYKIVVYIYEAAL